MPSAALGVVALEGDGGTGSAKWAKEFLSVGYDVVLFIDSDDSNANAMVPDVQQCGGTVVQWPGDNCIESAVCSQLDASGLNAYITAALEVADDPNASRSSFTDHLRKYVVPNGAIPAGLDVLDMGSWISLGIDLNMCRSAVSDVSKATGWFKRVDKGQRLGSFILETPSLQTGVVKATLNKLKAAIYARSARALPIVSEGKSQPVPLNITDHGKSTSERNAEALTPDRRIDV